MPVQTVILVMVALGLVYYLYRAHIIWAFYQEKGRLPSGRHSTSNLFFAGIALILFFYLWLQSGWPWYMLPAFIFALLLKLYVDFYYTQAQVFISQKKSPA